MTSAAGESNVARLLGEQAAAHPDRPALIRGDGTTRMTFWQLAGRADQLAAGLTDRGLRPGDRVAVLVRDRGEAVAIAAAVLWAGGVLVAPPTARGWRTALESSARARPAAVVADPLTWLLAAAFGGLARSRLRVVAARVRWPGFVSTADLARAGTASRRSGRGSGDPVPRPPDAAALLSWTTGSTGRPQAIVRTHAVLAAQHAAIDRLRSPRPEDVDLPGLPNVALHDLASGVPVVLPPAGDGPGGDRLRAVVVAAGATTAIGFPSLFERLVCGAPDGALPLLRSIHLGGAPVDPGLLTRLAAVAPNASVTVVYGATEAEPIGAIGARELLHAVAGARPGCGLPVGTACEGLEIRLAPPETSLCTGGPAADSRRDTRRPPPARGRILVRGACVAHVPSRSDADGWLDTGDVGALDGGGTLWLLGRASSGTVAGPPGAGRLFPLEVEEPIAALPGIAAAAVVSVARAGQPRALLAIEPADGTGGPSAACAARSFAQDRGWGIDSVVAIRRLPRDRASGKVDYRRLRTLMPGRGTGTAASGGRGLVPWARTGASGRARGNETRGEGRI